MISLSPTELLVANEYCKGLADKEVAGNLNKSVWTVKTQKRTIYRKLGISKDTELLLYMICDRLKRDIDLRRMRIPSRVRTAMRYIRTGRKNNNDFIF